MLRQIINGQILTPSGWLAGGSVLIENAVIVAVSLHSYPVAGAEIIDAEGFSVLPGGIDLHVHGGGGRDFEEGTEEAFRTVIATHMRHGTTAFFPTLPSASNEEIRAAIAVVEKLMSEGNSPVMGLHLEGPYFRKEMVGGQRLEAIRLPDAAEYEALFAGTDVIKRWDAAPELPGVEHFGRCCVAHGCLAGIAHTAACYDEVERAVEAGFSHATHFYNAMTGVHKQGLFKHEGVVESILALPEVTVEMIGDGIHVPPVILRMVHGIKGTGRVALVTDALACTDATPEEMKHLPDARIIIEDGVAKLSDRSAIAGSVATVDRMLRTAVEQARIPLEDAARMVSSTPAKIMGIDDRKGEIAEGKDADIVFYDTSLRVRLVMQMGRVVVNQC